MGTTEALLVGGLGVLWLVLLGATFRFPGSPRVSRLIFFQLLLLVSFLLGYFFLINVLKFNPNPLRVDLARRLTDNKMIYLGDIVPGLSDLDYIRRIDTDGVKESIKEEWLAFYQYDVEKDQESGKVRGPFGAAIYDYDRCRPPAMLSFELVPVDYDYLGQDAADVKVKNIISHEDDDGVDYPEVLIYGSTRGVVTDLNVFRRTGPGPSWCDPTPMDGVVSEETLESAVQYENVGSFRGNVGVRQEGATVTTVDRAPFERSQITIRRSYEPVADSYFVQEAPDYPRGKVLLDPVELKLAFGPAFPDDIPEVYYPEKAVLAFYLLLGKDRKNLERAGGYLSKDAQSLYNMRTDPFGLSTDPDNPARARSKLARVLVQEIKYWPDVEAERSHQEREITVTVLGVNEKDEYDNRYRCEVTWTVIGVDNPQALPYGCEWRLDSYWSTCEPGK
ncbi:hypothetical protein ACFLYD_08195 [Chloroflexota bacterium]